MDTGVIIKGVGGHYDICAGDEIIRCRARGKLRRLGMVPMVGDQVRITNGTDISEPVLEEILPRRNVLIRPPVANIDYLAIVIAIKDPEPDFYLVDKLIICAEKNNIAPLLIINKFDLATEDELDEVVREYRPTGYPVFIVSGKLDKGIQSLSNGLCDGIVTLAGQSGVGKSSIINRLHPAIQMETGGISEKVKRGRHTTRHVELLSLPYGGMMVDTPGFSTMDLMPVAVSDLQYCYREYLPYIEQCRFRGCIHRHEPQCAIKTMVEEGVLPKGRYKRYIKILEEIEGNRRNMW